jgi:hypothetical protein
MTARMARLVAGMARSKKSRRPRGRAVLIVLPLTPERVLQRAAKRFVDEVPDRCAKCGSTFVGREPAFIHCFYCGKMARIANASLLDQELFEIRSGLRLAS